jgi:hypothetical protein
MPLPNRAGQKVIFAGAILLTVISAIIVLPIALEGIDYTNLVKTAIYFFYLLVCACAIAWIIISDLKPLRQKLSISVPPIPQDATEEKILLLLDRDDADIYWYLVKHAARKTATQFAYHGQPIYDPKTKTFEFKKHVYHPKTINATVEN